MDLVEYHNKYAAKIYEDTVDVGMGDIMGEFLDQLEEEDTILDLGCSLGRDSLALYKLGYDVTLLDASEEVYKLAKIHTGLDVLQTMSEEMRFEDALDGIQARGSLLHVPKGEMGGVLVKLADVLCARGALYISVQEEGFEGFREERYFSGYTEDNLKVVLSRTDLFEIIRVWETEDVRSIHPDTIWINLLTRKK